MPTKIYVNRVGNKQKKKKQIENEVKWNEIEGLIHFYEV